jgi:hypothetical protein
MRRRTTPRPWPPTNEGELPRRFADWLRSIERAKSILDTVLLCGPSNPNAHDVGCSLNFVTYTVFSVKVGFGVLHRQPEGAVEYDLLHVHSIGTLAEQMLEDSEVVGAGGRGQQVDKAARGG